jgi:hypothetical protein
MILNTFIGKCLLCASCASSDVVLHLLQILTCSFLEVSHFQEKLEHQVYNDQNSKDQSAIKIRQGRLHLDLRDHGRVRVNYLQLLTGPKRDLVTGTTA